MSRFGDVVVLLPGITGSVLANKKGKEVWSPSGGAIWRAVTSLGNSIEDLELAGDDDPGGVTASRLIPDVTIVPGLIKIDGYSTVENYLIRELGLARGKNYFPFPYDWRLDNRVAAKRLETAAMDWLKQWRANSNPDAKLVLVGHSMGGLVSRYFLECLGGWANTRTLITLGTPHWGSLNAVGFLVHGMKKGVGPLGLDLSPLLRSLPSIYQLLPVYPCVDTGDAKLQGVADAAGAGQLPNMIEKRVRNAFAFHAEIEDAQKSNAKSDAYAERGYRMLPLVGIEQPTAQSARCRGNTVELLRSLNGEDHGGDGTVPRVSATPLELMKKDREFFAAEMHGSLQNADAALASVKGVLTAPDVELQRLRHAGLAADLSLDLDDVVLPDEPLVVRARVSEGNPRIDVELTNTTTGDQVTDTLGRGDEWHVAEFKLVAGTWRVRVSAAGAAPVTDLALVVAA